MNNAEKTEKKRPEETVTLTMTAAQMHKITECIDFMARMHAGDFDELVYRCKRFMAGGNDHARIERVKELCRDLKAVCRPDLEPGTSIHNEGKAAEYHDMRAHILNGYYVLQKDRPSVFPFWVLDAKADRIKVAVNGETAKEAKWWER